METDSFTTISDHKKEFGALRKMDSIVGKAKKKLNFADQVEVFEGLSNEEYDRIPCKESTIYNITEQLRDEIKEELNNFKRNEMAVHIGSIENTSFHIK